MTARSRSLWAIVPVILSFLLLGTYQLAQPPSPASLKPKIFVLGLSKTGTTSIGDALERLGYRRQGWRDIRSRHMVHTYIHSGHSALLPLTPYFDAFEDLPWPHTYRSMATLFPDAKFILSLRKDEASWLCSMQLHLDRGSWAPHGYFYGAETFEGNEDVILAAYRNHTENVREFFAGQPGRYMELTIDDGDVNWDVLCKVAECPGGKVPVESFPKSNAASSWEMGVVASKVRWVYGWALTRLEERISEYYYHGESTTWRPVLSLCWRFCDFSQRVGLGIYFRALPWLQAPLEAGDSAQGTVS